MSTQAIYDKLTDILCDVFDRDDLVATPDLNAAMVEQWDSMNNIRLFVAIEQTLGVRFSAAEISEIDNVGELTELIAAKLG